MSNLSVQYNAGELSDLVAAKDVDLNNLNNAYQQIVQQWKAADAPTQEKWDQDYQAMQAAYQSERSHDEHYIAILKDVPFSTLGSFDATTEYQDTLTALNATWAQNTPAPGSFDDLQKRLQAAYSSLSAPYPGGEPIPQPNPSYDQGLDPTSWEGYATGFAAWAGFVNPANVPPGTPGTPGGPALIPSWLKWIGGGALGLLAISTINSFRK